MSTPSVGDRAPSFEVTTARGESLSLDRLRGRTVALIFLRHLGCSICRLELATLTRRHEEFERRGVTVIVFVESADENVREYARRNAVRFHLVADPERVVYRAYGVDRGGLGAYLAPSVMLRAARATFAGHMHGRFEGHELQLPADFVLDANGTVIFAHRGRTIADNAPLDALLSAVPA